MRTELNQFVLFIDIMPTIFKHFSEQKVFGKKISKPIFAA
jgi:hypothetical protein